MTYNFPERFQKRGREASDMYLTFGFWGFREYFGF